MTISLPPTRRTHPMPLLLVLALRWIALSWTATIGIVSDQVQRPVLASAVLLGLIMWTAWLTVARPRRIRLVLIVDLAVAIALLGASAIVLPREQVLTDHPSLAGVYPMAVIATWAVVEEIRGGLVAGAALALTLPAMYALNGAPPTEISFLQLLEMIGRAASYPLVGVTLGAASAQLERLALRSARWTERAAQLSERERLAADIHDDVLQELGRARKRIRELADGGGAGGEQLRMLAVDLGHQERTLRMLTQPAPPAAQGKASLDAALAHLVTEHQTLPVEFASSETVELPTAYVAEMVAATREALSNVDKHALARRAWVTLLASTEEVAVYVRDDGIGMMVDGIDEAGQGRLGLLVSIKARVERLGGRARLESNPGGGTEVEFRLPRTLPATGAG
jgi:signal transduction histidine kinase